jgi:uncharacterized protein YjbI with pentapeptide repeats
MRFLLKLVKRLFHFIIWLVWDFSGVRFFWEKIRPPVEDSKPKRRPSTFILWAAGILLIYIALYGIVSQRYENRIMIIENRANSIFDQLSVPDTNVRKNALSSISTAQNMTCPYEPELLQPVSIFRSGFRSWNTPYHEIVELLKTALVNWKDQLDSVELKQADLRNAMLQQAKLNKANLTGADLSGANLMNADLRGTVLSGADLTNATLRGADLTGALIQDAILQGADLRIPEEKDTWKETLFGRDPEWAKRSGGDQLCTAKTLYEAKLDPELVLQIKEKCPSLLEKPSEPQSGTESN